MRSLVLAVPLSLLLTGCSGGTTRVADSPPVPTTTEALAPTPVTTTETPSEAPTPTPVATTAAPTPTAAPTRVRPAADGDVDGDGKPDVVRATGTLLTVVLSRSGKRVTAPVHAEGPGSAAVLGVTDVDRDGFAEVFLETARGASATFTTPYRFDGTKLHELQLHGAPLRLGIGGTVLHGDGFACTTAGLLEIRSADSSDGQAFTVHSDVYRLGVSLLTLVKSITVKAKQGTPAVERSYNAYCGPVGAGG